MPLSEREEEALAEIERHLTAEDPHLVARAEGRGRLSGQGSLPPRRRLVLAAVGGVVGLVCILLLTVHVAFGVAGFLLLLGSITAGVHARRAMQVPDVEVLEDQHRDPRH